jgi:hypothetical protein
MAAEVCNSHQRPPWNTILRVPKIKQSIKEEKKSRSDLCSTEEELQCLDLEEDMPHLLEEEGVTEPTNYTK